MLLIAVVTALAVAMTAVVCVASVQRPARSVDGSARLAAVLVPGLRGSEIVIVDTDGGRVSRRIGLRSLVTDIDADPVKGTIVAAQTGGIGSAADDAVSFSDPRTGEVRYVTLPRIDPSQVRCIAGRAIVLHSVVESSGYVVSVVDLASESVVATGHAPDGPGLWGAAGGSVWTSVPTAGAARFALARLDPVTLRASRVPGIGFSPAGVASVGDGVAVFGTGVGSAGTSTVAVVDAKSGAVTATATVPGLAHGAQSGVSVGDALVVGDWNGELPETPSLAVLDARTLGFRRSLIVGGAPCALVACGDDLLVVDRVGGTLRRIDPVSGALRWSVDLGARDMVCSRVLVLAPATGAGSSADPGGTRVAGR
jgi:hypothetical protein